MKVKKKIWIISLFPEFFKPLINCGVVGQALKGDREAAVEFELKLLDLRDYSEDKYKGVDDSPFGGGPGMVLRADILFNALDDIRKQNSQDNFDKLHVIYTSPRGRVWERDYCYEFSTKYLQHSDKDIVFICGRYEGVDERFLEKYVDEFISIGDYVLSGGEIAVMSILDSALRYVPGVLGKEASFQEDSFEDGLIEYPQYTRPRIFQGMEAPNILLSGHHKKIKDFQKEEQEKMTQKYRADLWKKYLDKKD